MHRPPSHKTGYSESRHSTMDNRQKMEPPKATCMFQKIHYCTWFSGSDTGIFTSYPCIWNRVQLVLYALGAQSCEPGSKIRALHCGLLINSGAIAIRFLWQPQKPLYSVLWPHECQINTLNKLWRNFVINSLSEESITRKFLLPCGATHTQLH